MAPMHLPRTALYQDLGSREEHLSSHTHFFLHLILTNDHVISFGSTKADIMMICRFIDIQGVQAQAGSEVGFGVSSLPLAQPHPKDDTFDPPLSYIYRNLPEPYRDEPEEVMAPATPSDKDEARPQNGIGPHPSYIQVAKTYIFEQTIQDCMKAVGTEEAKDVVARLQGVTYIDNVRKALSL